MEKVVNGKWNIYTKFKNFQNFGKKLSKLLIVNEKFKNQLDEQNFRYYDIIGIDTGQIAIFEDIISVKLLKKYGYYVTFNNGMIADTGIGDGFYQVYVAKNQKKIIAVFIDFSLHPLVN